MSHHPVQFRVDASPMRRMHVIVRLVLLAALAAAGCSSVYWLLYLALPVVAALVLWRDGAGAYLGDEAPSTVRVLRWLAGAYAYLWLLTDAPPGDGPVHLDVEVGGHPTTASALLRLVTSLPALALLVVLSLAASLLWVVGAAAILATGRAPAAVTDFIATKLALQFRLVAYHLSLVDAYPAIGDLPPRQAPHSSAT